MLGVIDDQSRKMEIKRRALEAAAPLSLPQMERAIAQAYKSGVPRLKTSAVFAMGKNCDPRWLPILIKELASADAEIRFEAAGACGELGEHDRRRAGRPARGLVGIDLPGIGDRRDGRGVQPSGGGAPRIARPAGKSAVGPARRNGGHRL